MDQLLDDLCKAIGALGRCLFEIVKTIFKYLIKFVDDVLSWANELVERCWAKLQEGWRMYYVDVDVESIPPNIIPRERLQGAKKVSLGIMTDRNMNPKTVDRAFVHTTEDQELKSHLGSNGVLELEL